MQSLQILLTILLSILSIAVFGGFAYAVAYLKLRLPTTTKRAQILRQYNATAREQLRQIRPFLTLDPASEAPLSTLDKRILTYVLEIKPLLQHLEDNLLPELQRVWQVNIDPTLLIPFKVTERIAVLEAARKQIDSSYVTYLDDRGKLRRIVTLVQKYARLQQIINHDLQRQRQLVDGTMSRLKALRQISVQDFYDVELQIERLSDSLHEIEALFAFDSLAEQPEGVNRFRHAFDLMYPRIVFLSDVLPKLNYRLHQLTRAQRFLQREQQRLRDLDQTIHQQMEYAKARDVEVDDLWQRYEAAQVNLVRAQQVFRARSTETFISMAGSLTKRGESNDTRLNLISAELRNILSETRTRLSTTLQLQHLNEAIHLLGDLHEEILNLQQSEGESRYEKYLPLIADLSLEFERRRETLEDKKRRSAPAAAPSPQTKIKASRDRPA